MIDKLPSQQLPTSTPKPNYVKLVIILTALVTLTVGAGLWSLKAYTKNLQNQIVIVSPTLEANTDSATDVSNWKTYSNGKYGFEIKYPSTFEALSRNDVSVAINSTEKNDPEGILIFIHEIPVENISALEEYIARDKELPDHYKNQRLKFNGYDAVSSTFEYNGTTSDLRYIYLYAPNFVVTIRYNDQHLNQNNSRISQILSTFKFTDLADISNWKTYKNEKYGFELKYPNDWKVEETDHKIYFSNKNEQRPGYGININIIPASLSAYLDTAEVLKTDVVTVNGTEWTVKDLFVKYLPEAPYSTAITTTKNNQTYMFFVTNVAEESLAQLKPIHSTFKFFDSLADTTNWKTYSGSTTNVVFQYPVNWSIGVQSETRIVLVNKTLESSNNSSLSLKYSDSWLDLIKKPCAESNAFLPSNIPQEKTLIKVICKGEWEASLVVGTDQNTAAQDQNKQLLLNIANTISIQ